jgi:hypothetical protein
MMENHDGEGVTGWGSGGVDRRRTVGVLKLHYYYYCICCGI